MDDLFLRWVGADALGDAAGRERVDHVVLTEEHAGSYVGRRTRRANGRLAESDALGNLVPVTEPNPAGGADWVTDYTYNPFGQLVGVAMPTGRERRRGASCIGDGPGERDEPGGGTVTYEYADAPGDEADGREGAADAVQV